MSPICASMHASARRLGTAAAVVLAMAVPACASHAGGSSPSRTVDTAGGIAPAATLDTTAGTPANSSRATLSTAVGGSARTSPPGSSAGATAAGVPAHPALAYCRSNQLAITATRLPGAAGTSYAQITLVNTSAAACQVTGYPAVILVDAAAAPLGGSAAHLGTVTAAVVLRSREAASTLLQDSLDSCRATTRSAAARIAPPEQAGSVVLPLVMATCPLALRPFTAGTNPVP
jgi:Protein of unknown function (DUF4232)